MIDKHFLLSFFEALDLSRKLSRILSVPRLPLLWLLRRTMSWRRKASFFSAILIVGNWIIYINLLGYVVVFLISVPFPLRSYMMIFPGSMFLMPVSGLLPQ